ncbi:hypothetical protein BGZ94_009500 [Podila epigama]|nr:hypothetical protein BGZ94_009500 [Podila epigama]
MPPLSVCEDLDSMVVQYMSLVDEHLAIYNRISTKFQEGREFISEAKYIMGPKNVSSDCYDNRMKAIRGVSFDTATSVSICDLAAERRRIAQEEEEREQRTKELKDIANKLSEVDISKTGQTSTAVSSGGLRRRAGGMTTARSEGSSSGEGQETADDAAASRQLPESESNTTLSQASPTPKKKKERNPDPLLWFGVFVPGSLRNAQSVFQKSLQDVIDLTNVRQKLLQLEQDIVRLQGTKGNSVVVTIVPSVINE